MSSTTNLPKAWIAYVSAYQVERDYFECHEILEEYWKECAESRRPQPGWVGWIQLAVAQYHERRGNVGGAIKMLTSALDILRTFENWVDDLGINSGVLLKAIEMRLQLLESRKVKSIDELRTLFNDLDLPLNDLFLKYAALEFYQKHYGSEGKWGIPSRDVDVFILNKHTLRDRSEVIEARERAVKIKKNTREQ